MKKNTVSMPYTNDAGELKFKEISIFDTVHNLHRGPGDGLYYSVIEVKTSERILTLYTKDSTQMQQFYNYFLKALEFINVVNYKQK